MSVIVKGMEMPKNCYECPMESANWCNILEKRVESIDRHQDCPLVEIPQHGDLVDRSEITVEEDVYYQTYIIHAPTVIEAEGSEE